MEIEHLGLNVADPAAAADWYVQHLGMRIVLASDEPVPVRFLADSAGHVMLEIYRNPEADVPSYADVDPLVLHLAFRSDDVAADAQRLLAAGATPAQEPFLTDSGDAIAIVRDPWGFPVQLAQRHAPMV